MLLVVNFVPFTVMLAPGGMAPIVIPSSSRVETCQVPWSASRSVVFLAAGMKSLPEKLYSEQDALRRRSGNIAPRCRDIAAAGKDRPAGHTPPAARRGRSGDRGGIPFRIHAARTHRY